MTEARYCEHCGAELSGAEALFCPSCGASVGMVSFTEAIRLAWQRYFVFSGRSTRAEYWWWALFTTLVYLILTVVEDMTGLVHAQTGIGLFNALFNLGVLSPTLALGARRLHDINRSGWWQLMLFGSGFVIATLIPLLVIVPFVVLIVWAIKPGDRGPNKYGPDPRQATSQ